MHRTVCGADYDWLLISVLNCYRFLSLMLQRLHLPAALDGNVWRYSSPAEGNRRHRHSELELNLVVRGIGVYLLGGNRYEIRRGDLLWLFPAQEHVLFEQSGDFEMWVAVFRRRAVKRNATDVATKVLLQNSFRGEVCRRLKPQDLQRCEDLFVELAGAGEHISLLNAGLGYALLEAWKCFQRASEVQMQEMHPGVERAAWLIRSETAEGSFAELAKDVGLSASRLSRLFRMQMGVGLVEFRNRQRVERFFDAYGAGKKTLLAAALEAGFGSYPQFHRVFRSVMGYSPREHGRRSGEKG
jgi:AraC-like DNA-binding protein